MGKKSIAEDIGEIEPDALSRRIKAAMPVDWSEREHHALLRLVSMMVAGNGSGTLEKAIEKACEIVKGASPEELDDLVSEEGEDE